MAFMLHWEPRSHCSIKAIDTGIMANSRINGFYAALGAALSIPFALLMVVDDDS